MALESFYGGKQGVSPVIKASFKFINKEDPSYNAYLSLGSVAITQYEAERLIKAGFRESIHTSDENGTTKYKVEWTESMLNLFTMDECFKNVDYTDVWYDELCIIDTENKLNPNNGKIFRRTLKRYQNPILSGFTDEDSLYAEYIGQIVGPSGGVPNIFFGSIDAARKKAAGLQKTLESDGNNITPENSLDVSGWDYSYPKETEDSIIISTENVLAYTPEDRTDDDNAIAVLNSEYNSDNISLIPGKDENGYNDNIKYTWCNVRRTLTNGGQEDAWIYLGFEIPYTFWDTAAEDIPYWDNRESFRVDTQIVDGKFHPFYHNLTFYIPRGARGIGPEQLFIVGKDNHNKPATLYDFDAIHYDYETDTYSILNNTSSVDPNSKDKTKRPHKRDNNNQIIANEYIDQTATYWVAKWRLYNPKTTNIVDVYQYIGAYKDIKSVQLLDTGELQIQYSNEDAETWTTLNTIKWIKDISIDTNLKNNNGNDDNNNYGKAIITYNTKKTDNTNDNETFEKILPLTKDITHDLSTGKLTFSRADGSTIIPKNPIQEILDMRIKTSNGHLYVKYTDGTNHSEDLESDNFNTSFQNSIDPADDYGYTDLGLVSGNPTVGIVAEIIKSEDTNWANQQDILAILEKGYSDANTTISKEGKIIVNNKDVTGGFVGADFGNDTFGLFYYVDGWKYAGTINGSGGSNKIKDISFVTTKNNGNNTYKSVSEPDSPTATNIEIKFKDSFTTIIDNYKPNDPNSVKPEKIHKDFLDTFWDPVESS